MKTVDVGAVIDEGRWTGYQKLLIVGTALTIILDGVDNQLLPNAVPFIAPEWGVQNSAFRNALATGPFGMMIGGLMGGILGDRYGRRTALPRQRDGIRVLTLSIAFVTRSFMLGLLRFLAGIGLGGAMPNAAALASEYVPRHRASLRRDADHRLHSARWLRCQHDGWPHRAGLRLARPLHRRRRVPMVLAFVLWKVLPESPRYLASRRDRWQELTAGHASDGT